MKHSKRGTPFYPALRCPYCHGQLYVVNAYAIQCDCDQFPVIERIVYLKKFPDNRHRRAITFLSRGYKKAALLTLLDSRRVANILALSVPFLPVRIMARILERIFPAKKAWWRYVGTRESRATHLISLVPLGAVHTGDTVVDIGCGSGEFLQKASGWTKAHTLIGVDTSFFSLFIARRTIVPNSVFLICADVRSGIPLMDRSAHLCFLNDVYMYIDQQHGLSELHRILRTSGEAFLGHVHSNTGGNVAQGKGVNPTTLNIQARGMFTTGFLPDNMFIGYLTTRRNVVYRTKLLRQYTDRSFSYRLLPLDKQPHSFLPPKHLVTFVKEISIDYTEDEHLKP